MGTRKQKSRSGLTSAQIGRCGELLVQYELLLLGVDSSRMSTDAGVDLVAYSPVSELPKTIQVKANLKPKPGGGKGKPSLDWWIPEGSPAQIVALTDLSTRRIWIFKMQEIAKVAQQRSSGKFHLYMNTDPTLRPRKTDRLSFAYEFERYLLENRSHELFG